MNRVDHSVMTCPLGSGLSYLVVSLSIPVYLSAGTIGCFAVWERVERERERGGGESERERASEVERAQHGTRAPIAAFSLVTSAQDNQGMFRAVAYSPVRPLSCLSA